MIAAWMLYAAGCGAALALAAWAAERAALAARRAARWGWAAAIAASVLLPAAVAWRARFAGAANAGRARARTSAVAALPPALPVPRPWDALDAPLVVLWAAASAGALARLGRAARDTRRAAAAWPVRIVAGTPAHVSEATGPAVFGVRRPAVVLPAWALADPRLPLILAHEREHLAARDPLLLAAAAVAAALAPWNPALWWQLHRLRAAVELDCDRRVLAAAAARASPHDYGRLLLDVAARPAAPGALTPVLALTAGHPLIRRRITVMTAPRAPRALVPLGVAAASLLAAFACAAPHPAATPTPRAVAGNGLPDSTLWIINGRVVDRATAEHSLPADSIYSVNVIKGPSAVARFGQAGRNGVVVITTKSAAHPDSR